VTAVQYRDKAPLEPGERVRRAEQLAADVRAAGALFIVNDDLEAALAVASDGVHLGPHDRSIASARRLAPPPFLLGGSVGTVAAARERAREGAS
jgi:thiamine-phosphate pyrophosphorylase